MAKFNLTTIGDGYTKNSVAVQNGDTDLDFSDLPFKALAIIKATLDQDVGDVRGEAGLEGDGGLVVRWLTTASAVG